MKNKILAILFIIIIFGFGILSIIFKDNEISSFERRKLAKFPEITLKAILDTTFMDKFEDYTMDQFVVRDKFRSLKAFTELKEKGISKEGLDALINKVLTKLDEYATNKDIEMAVQEVIEEDDIL